MMKLDIRVLLEKVKPLLAATRRYAVLIFILAILSGFGFLAFRIGTLTNTEPSEDAVDEKLLSVKRPKVDQDALQKIQELQDQNITVQTLFKEARDNPFEE